MKKLNAVMELVGFFINEKDIQSLNNILDSYNPVLKFSLKGKAMGEHAGDFWGFNIVERDVVFAIVPKEKSADILNLACNMLSLNEKHHGMGFSAPISSASSILAGMFVKKENQDEN